MTGDPWQLMPALSDDEYAALRADVAAHGVRVPVVVDAETGDLLDGHHRVRAWEEVRAEGVKVPDYPRQIVRFRDDDERRSFVLAANVLRRHLSRTQRRELAARLRSEGWSLRRIGEAVGASPATVHADVDTVQDRTVPERIVGKDGRSQPATRPPSLFVGSRRDAERARRALAALPDGVAPSSLLRAEERAREAEYRVRRETAEVAARLQGTSYELRVGDLREVWADVPDQSLDSIVTDPPYDAAGVPLYEDLAQLAARVLKPGRLAAIYCGHVHLDDEMRLLERGGITYMWHGVNVLPGRSARIRSVMVNGGHRSVVLYSAGRCRPRRWIYDTFIAAGRGGPETRQLHPWQQAVEPLVHWVAMVSEPGETVFDPFVGSGTTAVAALSSGRRFLGGDLVAGNVETTRDRIEALGSESGEPA